MNTSLANKYRPREFSDVVSQESVVKILEKQIQLKQYKNAYLFCGASGVGKTSLCRILASKINGNLTGVQEIDAASNNGVDNIRTIVKSAQERSVTGEYKIFIFDECFTGDTIISTSEGTKRIDKLVVGDKVLNINGTTVVQKIHEKLVPLNRLCTIKLNNGVKINCTKDHLFMTTKGYIRASELVQGDEVIYDENMRSLWKAVRSKNTARPSLFQEMFRGYWEKKPRLSKEFKEIYSQLCNLWQDMGGHSQKISTDLFQELLLCPTITETEGTLCLSRRGATQEIVFTKSQGNCGIWKTYKRTGRKNFYKDEAQQSFKKSTDNTKNKRNKNEKWNSRMVRETRWERTYNCTPKEAIRRIRNFLGIRVSSKDPLFSEQSKSLSYMLQVRPSLSREKDWDRGGWQFPQIEKNTVAGYKESNFATTVRVERVEIYKSTSDAGYTNSDSNNIKVYDITVEGHPSYFANGVLVHNCHSLTNQAWQSLLKCLEEPPAYTIFMLCTTESQKVPATIVNRCQKFNLSKISNNKILDRLAYICKQEGFTNYEESIVYISKISNGGLRDAISTLEKVASYSEDFDIKTTLNVLGNYSYQLFFNLANSIIDSNQAQVLQIISDIYYQGQDLKVFVDKFFAFCLDITKYCLFKNFSLLEIPESFNESINSCINFDTPEKYYIVLVNKLLELKSAIKNDTDIKSTVEAYFLNMSRWE